jgi:NIMA (never in mitosis gene a)-related kinase
MLHRDLKSQNVFLTANNTVKLGDFGISKVLENTNDVAMTVQGTPYYMSPEVCQSKPYDYKSDVWALGCILYELATLKHAFNAENLLGLVFKIVQDKQDPIPNIYSQELKNLVSLLLIKDERQRPNVLDILRMDFVKQHMRLFVETQGQNNVNPKLHQRRDIQPEVVQQMLAKDVKELTAVERQRLKKEQRHIEEFELMKQAAAAAK